MASSGDGTGAVEAVVVAMHEEPPATDVDALPGLAALRCVVGSLDADATAADADGAWRQDGGTALGQRMSVGTGSVEGLARAVNVKFKGGILI